MAESTSRHCSSSSLRAQWFRARAQRRSVVALAPSRFEAPAGAVSVVCKKREQRLAGTGRAFARAAAEISATCPRRRTRKAPIARLAQSLHALPACSVRWPMPSLRLRRRAAAQSTHATPVRQRLKREPTTVEPEKQSSDFPLILLRVRALRAPTCSKTGQPLRRHWRAEHLAVLRRRSHWRRPRRGDLGMNLHSTPACIAVVACQAGSSMAMARNMAHRHQRNPGWGAFPAPAAQGKTKQHFDVTRRDHGENGNRAGNQLISQRDVELFCQYAPNTTPGQASEPRSQ